MLRLNDNMNFTGYQPNDLNDIIFDSENFSDHELPLSSIITIDNCSNSTKRQEIYIDDNNIDIDDFSDNELPLSSISNVLLPTKNNSIVNNEIKIIESNDRQADNCHSSKPDINLKSNRKQRIINNLNQKYECDICGKKFRKRILIIEHFKTSLCFPECTFYFENDGLENSWFSRSKNSILYSNSKSHITSYDIENTINCRNYQSGIQNNELIKNNQLSNTKENNLKLNFCSNINSISNDNACKIEEHIQTFKESFCRSLTTEALEFVQLNSIYFNDDNMFSKLAIPNRSIENHCLNYKQLSGLSFSTKQKRIIDMKNVNQCNVCHKDFQTEIDVSKHISEVHNISHTYECSKCSKIFHKRLEIISHIYNNHQEEYSKYSCDSCSRLYKSSQEFILHLDKNLFKCDICPQSFTTSYRLHQHYRWHLGIDGFKCQYCPRTFSKYSDYLHHERIHTEEKPFRCNFCGKWFPVSSNINVHFITHKQFVCYICQKAFDLLSLLLSHKTIHTQNEFLNNKSFDKLIPQSTSLKIPATKFTDTEMIKCNLCCKSFIQLSVLISHLKTHVSTNLHNVDISSGIVSKLCLNRFKKKYFNKEYLKCNLCQGKFYDQNSYLAHSCSTFNCKMYPKLLSNTYLRKKHNKNIPKNHNYKPYKCDICKKLFMHSTSVNRHKKKHIHQFGKIKPLNSSLKIIEPTKQKKTVLKKYTCDLCSKTFHDQSQIVSHILKTHY